MQRGGGPVQEQRLPCGGRRRRGGSGVGRCVERLEVRDTKVATSGATDDVAVSCGCATKDVAITAVKESAAAAAAARMMSGSGIKQQDVISRMLEAAAAGSQCEAANNAVAAMTAHL